MIHISAEGSNFLLVAQERVVIGEGVLIREGALISFMTKQLEPTAAMTHIHIVIKAFACVFQVNIFIVTS